MRYIGKHKMSILSQIFNKSLAENEKNLRFWEDYLQNLKSLNFNNFSDRLKVPVLVPIGSRILFRGELKHTNEVTVALGADYFVKCSIHQAEILRQHRIKDAESKLQSFHKEREYIENQFSFSKQAVFEEEGKEILEVQTEEEDKVWREKHRSNVRKWKQKKEEKEVAVELTDEELWEKLEELELKEELENELEKDKPEEKTLEVKYETVKRDKEKWEIIERDTNTEEEDSAEETAKPGKSELLQKVIDKQNKLEEKLMELRNKERSRSKTEQDLIAKLDEMEELEDVEDEMDRLEDIIETEDRSTDESEDETSTSSSQPVNLKRKVSFADEDDSETLQFTFHHTDVEPVNDPYDPTKGIAKPSDIYEAYSSLFANEATSILKKVPYQDRDSCTIQPIVEMSRRKQVECPEPEVKTIVVKDVIEKMDVDENRCETSEKRPASLFKQRRQQGKT